MIEITDYERLTRLERAVAILALHVRDRKHWTNWTSYEWTSDDHQVIADLIESVSRIWGDLGEGEATEKKPRGPITGGSYRISKADSSWSEPIPYNELP